MEDREGQETLLMRSSISRDILWPSWDPGPPQASWDVCIPPGPRLFRRPEWPSPRLMEATSTPSPAQPVLLRLHRVGTPGCSSVWDGGCPHFVQEASAQDEYRQEDPYPPIFSATHANGNLSQRQEGWPSQSGGKETPSCGMKSG